MKVSFFVSKGGHEDKSPRHAGYVMVKASSLTVGKTVTVKRCINKSEDDYPSQYPGTFNFGVNVDSDNQVAESNEKNWKGGRVFTLTESSTLVISQLWFSNPVPNPGETVTAYARIRNNGSPFGSDKVNSEWRIQGPQYGPDPIILGFDQTKRDHLRTDDETGEDVTFVTPTTPGSYVLSFDVDYDFRLNQSDRSGNTGSLAFTIPEPPGEDGGEPVVDPNLPVACPLITPSTWSQWSVQPYGAPFDFFDGNRLVISPICNRAHPDALDMTFGKDGDTNVLVYKTVYIKNGKTGASTSFTVNCRSVDTGSYCQGGAWLNISGIHVDTSSVSQPTLILAYTCHFVGGSWKCGCKDESCTTSAWQQEAAAVQ